jgi:hypothetical protein
VVRGFLQSFEEGVRCLCRRKAHSLCFKNEGNFDGRTMRATGERVFQLADLGDGDAARFRFWAEGKKVGMALQFRIEKVGG